MSGRRGLIPLDAVKKVRRYQNGLEGRGDAFLERVALLARQRHQPEKRLHLARRYRAPEGAAGETCQDRARAGRGVLARCVPADIHLSQALRRWCRDLVERTADVDRLVAVIDTLL